MKILNYPILISVFVFTFLSCNETKDVNKIEIEQLSYLNNAIEAETNQNGVFRYYHNYTDLGQLISQRNDEFDITGRVISIEFFSQSSRERTYQEFYYDEFGYSKKTFIYNMPGKQEYQTATYEFNCLN